MRLLFCFLFFTAQWAYCAGITLSDEQATRLREDIADMQQKNWTAEQSIEQMTATNHQLEALASALTKTVKAQRGNIAAVQRDEAKFQAEAEAQRRAKWFWFWTAIGEAAAIAGFIAWKLKFAAL